MEDEIEIDGKIYISVRSVKKMFHCTSTNVAFLARKLNWKKAQEGRQVYYLLDDVDRLWMRRKFGDNFNPDSEEPTPTRKSRGPFTRYEGIISWTSVDLNLLSTIGSTRENIEIGEKIFIRGDLISDLFGWSRQNLSQVAQREGWERIRDYHCYYLKSDVDRYILDREHTLQAKSEGLWLHRGLINHGVDDCPICNNGDNHGL